MVVLFVCSGNINRSPYAEVVLRKMAEEAGRTDIEVLSAGTFDLNGRPRGEVMIRKAAERGYEMGGRSVLLTSEMCDRADLILHMDESQRNFCQQNTRYGEWSKLHLFSRYCFNTDKSVPDPDYQTDFVYKTAMDMIEEGCRVILGKMEKYRK